MTKRRSSIQGRGAEILRGEPPPVPFEPLGLDVALAERGVPGPAPAEPGLTLDEEELKGLFEEAQAGGPAPPGEEEGLPAQVPAPPPTPEMESALITEAAGAEEPPEPVAEVPAPTMEVTMKEKVLREKAAIHEPPPPETSNVAGDILPPRPVPTALDLGEIKPIALDLQEPEKKTEPLVLPERALTEEEKQQILARLGDARIQGLDTLIDTVYEEVRHQVAGNDEIATDCYNKLLQGRDIILRRDALNIAQAEYYIEQARIRLKRAAESQAGAKRYAWWIAGWGLFWFAAYTTVLLLYNFSWFAKVVAPTVTGNTPVDMEVFVPAMIWGGIGGVACVFYSLFKHVGARDFDTQYNLSYVGKPFLGIILGATVYMIIRLLILVLGIMPAGVQGTEAGATTVAPWIIYLMAWACGFKENRIFDLVDRVMKRIFSGQEAAPAPPAGPVAPAG